MQPIPKSYIAVLKANTGTLLGGVRISISSRFEWLSDALDFKDQAIKANEEANRDVIGEVFGSTKEPEIYHAEIAG